MKESLAKDRIGIVTLGLSLALLVTIAFLNRHTPFRGEHWALLYTYVNAPDWMKRFELISHFACFGVTRFQPLGFFPQVVSYQLLGAAFFAHYLLSISIHVVQTYLFLKLLDRFRSDSSDTRSVFNRYPMEGALFLVLFPGTDVLFWTFFHHVQLATLLASASLLVYLTPSSSYGRRLLAFALMIAATAIYEAFLPGVVVYLAVEGSRFCRRERSAWLGTALLVVSVAAFGVKYGLQYSQLERSQWLSVPLMTRAMRSVDYTLLALAVFVSNSIWPTAAWRGEIYTLAIPSAIQTVPFALFSLGTGISFCLIFLVVKRKTPSKTSSLYALCLACAVGILFLIVWARSFEGPVASSAQFRYAFVIMPCLVAVALDVAYRLLAGRWRFMYGAALAVLIAVNALATLRHGLRLRDDMEDMTDYVETLKKEGFTANEIVTDVTRRLATARLPLSPRSIPRLEFLLNGDGCAEEWVYRTAGREKQYAELRRTIRNTHP